MKSDRPFGSVAVGVVTPQLLQTIAFIVTSQLVPLAQIGWNASIFAFSSLTISLRLSGHVGAAQRTNSRFDSQTPVLRLLLKDWTVAAFLLVIAASISINTSYAQLLLSHPVGIASSICGLVVSTALTAKTMMVSGALRSVGLWSGAARLDLIFGALSSVWILTVVLATREIWLVTWSGAFAFLTARGLIGSLLSDYSLRSPDPSAKKSISGKLRRVIRINALISNAPTLVFSGIAPATEVGVWNRASAIPTASANAMYQVTSRRLYPVSSDGSVDAGCQLFCRAQLFAVLSLLSSTTMILALSNWTLPILFGDSRVALDLIVPAMLAPVSIAQLSAVLNFRESRLEWKRIKWLQTTYAVGTSFAVVAILFSPTVKTLGIALLSVSSGCLLLQVLPSQACPRQRRLAAITALSPAFVCILLLQFLAGQ